ncbi:MAG: 50S ribosomal protein L11 methyltransferase [Alphaproteobacteria bacterium]|nr:50S ribosomal protein L11 methyltransferase [Alphaproteobacteria bacterium]
MTHPPLWKASVALARHEAADLAAALELAGDAQAVLIAEEPFADGAVVEALYTEEPDTAYLSKVVGRAVTVAPLPDQDWIRLSQEGLPPVRAGRFFVYGAHDAGKVPHGVIPIKIEAGLAFGTGHHETTALCLDVLSGLARGRAAFRHVLDLGTGTGLLAIGAAKLWKGKVLASDIDPVAVEVTKANARANGVAPLVAAVTADGLDNPLLKNGGPYDLIIANILAGPLTRLAPTITRALAPGGTLLLSGLLRNQELLVTSFYPRLRLLQRRRMGPWSALVLERP